MRRNYTSPAPGRRDGSGFLVNSAALGALYLVWNHGHHKRDQFGKWASIIGGSALVGVAQELLRDSARSR